MTDLHFLSPESDDQFIEEVCAALRQTGGLLPVTDREVELAEESIPSVGAPSSSDLPDPHELFVEGMDACPAPSKDKGRAPSRRGPQNEVEQSMAIAARDGKKVSKEVRQKMLEDRKRAERQHENGQSTDEEQ